MFLPKIAKNKKLLSEVEAVVQQIPTGHRLVLGDVPDVMPYPAIRHQAFSGALQRKSALAAFDERFDAALTPEAERRPRESQAAQTDVVRVRGAIRDATLDSGLWSRV